MSRRLHRRKLLVTAAGWAVAGGAMAQPAPGPDYAESVMLVLFAPDAGQELSIRLGRLIGPGSATLWARYAAGDQAFSMADAGLLAKGARPTLAAADAATFDQAAGAWTSRFSRAGRLRPDMTGEVLMTGGMHRTADPPEGAGPLAGSMEATFRALHGPVQVREGRLEVFGKGEGRIILPDRDIKFSGYAKWHEQVGERARFAPAFTYVALCGSDASLLAVKRGDTAYGFIMEHGRTTAVTALTVAEPGSERRFTATLADGRSVTGVMRTVRMSSEPIEGQRRPSATVRADTTLGPLVGQINEWRPAS